MNESSEKSESDSRENTRRGRNSVDKEKEKVCVSWIKSLNKMEVELNMEPQQNASDEEVPKFCCNKICPISDNKIISSTKVMKQFKKVYLRKALFRNNDERWY